QEGTPRHSSIFATISSRRFSISFRSSSTFFLQRAVAPSWMRRRVATSVRASIQVEGAGIGPSCPVSRVRASREVSQVGGKDASEERRPQPKIERDKPTKAPIFMKTSLSAEKTEQRK